MPCPAPSIPNASNQAHRAGLEMRLIADTRISPEKADTLILAWEAEAAKRGLDEQTSAWWEPAWDWIAERRRA